jgi:hypothetical protein
MHRETLAVAKAAVATDLHKASGVLAYLATQVAFSSVVPINVVTHARNFVFGEILDTSVWVYVCGLANLLCASKSDTINVSESNLYALIARKIDAVYTGQFKTPLLALALLVARVLADDVDLAVATNDLALVAHLLNRRAYLHRLSFPIKPTVQCARQVVLARSYILAQPLA